MYGFGTDIIMVSPSLNASCLTRLADGCLVVLFFSKAVEVGIFLSQLSQCVLYGTILQPNSSPVPARFIKKIITPPLSNHSPAFLS